MKRLVILAALLALTGASAHARPLPSAPRCSIFPKSNPWNQRVDKLPVAASSDAIIASIGADVGLHPDFGSGIYDGGTTFTVTLKALGPQAGRVDDLEVGSAQRTERG